MSQPNNLQIKKKHTEDFVFVFILFITMCTFSKQLLFNIYVSTDQGLYLHRPKSMI